MNSLYELLITDRADELFITPAEKRILRGLARKLNLTEMATAYGLDYDTIRTEYKTLSKKLGCNDKGDLIITCFEQGIIKVEKKNGQE